MTGVEYAAHLATADAEHDAALVANIRNATIAECQRFVRTYAEIIGLASSEAGRHYRAVADLIEVLKS